MWRVVVCLACGLAVAAFPAAPAAQSERTPSDLERWLIAVDGHTPGHADEPATEIGRWSRVDLRDGVVSRLRNAVKGPARTAVLKRGAMLHADIAMVRVLKGELTTVDPLGTPMRASYQAHLDLARQLLDWVEPEPGEDSDVRVWYRAVTAWLFNHYLLADAERHLERARRLFPDDPLTALDGGTLAETIASPSVQNVASQQRITPSTTFVIRAARTHLEQAERHFRRALDLDPGLVEARVRLGRTWTHLGRTDRAVEALERAAAQATDPLLVYYAQLFLGRAHEAAGNAAASIRAYEQAARPYPLAQSPLLALARRAATEGERQGSAGTVNRVLSLPWDEDRRLDPWWFYHQGIGRRAGPLVDELRGRVAALPRLADVARAPGGIEGNRR